MIKKIERIVLYEKCDKKKDEFVQILTQVPMSIDDIITLGIEYGFKDYHVVMDVLYELKERLNRQDKNKLN